MKTEIGILFALYKNRMKPPIVLFLILFSYFFFSSVLGAQTFDLVSLKKQWSNSPQIALENIEREIRIHYGWVSIPCLSIFKLFLEQLYKSKTYPLYPSHLYDEEWIKTMNLFDQCMEDFGLQGRKTSQDWPANGKKEEKGEDDVSKNKVHQLMEDYFKMLKAHAQASQKKDAPLASSLKLQTAFYTPKEEEEKKEEAAEKGKAPKKDKEEAPEEVKSFPITSSSSQKDFRLKTDSGPLAQPKSYTYDPPSGSFPVARTLPIQKKEILKQKLNNSYALLTEFEDLENTRIQALIYNQPLPQELEELWKEKKADAKDALLFLFQEKGLSRKERLNAYKKFKDLEFSDQNSIPLDLHIQALDLAQGWSGDYFDGLDSKKDTINSSSGSCKNTTALINQELFETLGDVAEDVSRRVSDSDIEKQKQPQFLKTSDASSLQEMTGGNVRADSSTKQKVEASANSLNSSFEIVKETTETEEEIKLRDLGNRHENIGKHETKRDSR